MANGKVLPNPSKAGDDATAAAAALFGACCTANGGTVVAPTDSLWDGTDWVPSMNGIVGFEAGRTAPPNAEFFDATTVSDASVPPDVKTALGSASSALLDG